VPLREKSCVFVVEEEVPWSIQGGPVEIRTGEVGAGIAMIVVLAHDGVSEYIYIWEMK
jgi:hypothetical protein